MPAISMLRFHWEASAMPLPPAPSPSMSLRLDPRGTGPSSHAMASTPLPWRDQRVVSSRCGRTSCRSTRRVQCTLWSEVRVGRGLQVHHLCASIVRPGLLPTGSTHQRYCLHRNHPSCSSYLSLFCPKVVISCTMIRSSAGPSSEALMRSRQTWRRRRRWPSRSRPE